VPAAEKSSLVFFLSVMYKLKQNKATTAMIIPVAI